MAESINLIFYCKKRRWFFKQKKEGNIEENKGKRKSKRKKNIVEKHERKIK